MLLLARVSLLVSLPVLQSGLHAAFVRIPGTSTGICEGQGESDLFRVKISKFAENGHLAARN